MRYVGGAANTFNSTERVYSRATWVEKCFRFEGISEFPVSF